MPPPPWIRLWGHIARWIATVEQPLDRCLSGTVVYNFSVCDPGYFCCGAKHISEGIGSQWSVFEPVSTVLKVVVHGQVELEHGSELVGLLMHTV